MGCLGFPSDLMLDEPGDLVPQKGGTLGDMPASSTPTLSPGTVTMWILPKLFCQPGSRPSVGGRRKAVDRVQAKAWPDEAELAFLTEGPKFKETSADTWEAAGTTGDPG